MKKFSKFWEDVAWRPTIFHSSGAQIDGSIGPIVSPASGDNVSPASRDNVSPASGDNVYSTSGTKVSSTSGTKVSSKSGTKVSSKSGTKVPSTSGAMVSTSEAKVSHTSGAIVTDTSRTSITPTSGVKDSSISPAMVSSTSLGNSGMGNRKPNFRDKDMNVIHKAAKEGNRWRMKQILFFRISDLNARDKMSRTALHVACAYGRPRMVRLLLKRECLLDLPDIEEKTALIQAIQYKSTKCATLLLDSGADPNIMDKDGNTALHYAVLDHNKAIVEKLLSCKANIEATNKSDLTPLALAKLVNNEKMMELLVSRGAKDDQRKQQLTSGKKREGRPQRSKKFSLVVYEVSKEDSLNSKQQLTSKYKEAKKPPKSESSNLATDLQESPNSAQIKTESKTVEETSAKGSLNSKQQQTSESEEERTYTLESSLIVEDISEREDSSSSKQQITSEYQESRISHTSESIHHVFIDLRHAQKQEWSETTSKSVSEISDKESSSRLSSISSIDDTRTTRHNEDFKDKVISETHTRTAKTSKNQRKHIHLPPLHLEKMTQESQVNRAGDKEDTATYSGHPSEQKDEEMCIKQSTLKQRKNLQLSKDESKQKLHEFSVKLKMTECPGEEPLRDNSKGQANLRQMPSNLTSKVLDCERKDTFGKSISAALPTFPEREETTHKIIPQSHAEPNQDLFQKPLCADICSANAYKSVGSKLKDESSSALHNGRTPGVYANEELQQDLQRFEKVECLAWKKEIVQLLKEVEGKKKQTSSKRKVSSNVYEGADDDNDSIGLSRHSTSENPDNQQPSDEINENTASFINKVEGKKKQKSSKRKVSSNVYEGADDDNDSIGLSRQNTSENPDNQQPSDEINENTASFINKVEGKKKQASSKRKVSSNVYEGADDDNDSIGLSRHSTSENPDNQQPSDEINENTASFINKVEGKKKQKSSKRKVSSNVYEGADNDNDSIGLSRQNTSENPDNQQPSDEINENTASFINKVEGKKKQTSSERKVSSNVYEGADDDNDSIGLSRQSTSEHPDNQQPSDESSENTVFFVNKVEDKKEQKSSKREVSGNMGAPADDRGTGEWSQQSDSEQTDKQQVSIMDEEASYRLCSKPGIDDDSKPTSHNEDLKDKVISETHTRTAKTSKNQRKHIHLPPLHLEKMTQESQVNRAGDKEDTATYSGHPSEQKDEEMCIKQSTLKQRKNLQLSKDESKQKLHEFSVKLKMTECPGEEPLRDNSKGQANLRQMPSNLTSKVLDCERKDAFGKSISAALPTFPEREETTLKIVSPSHADSGSPGDSLCPSFSLLCLREMELRYKNDHKSDAGHVLNKNGVSSYNDTEIKKGRTPVVTSEVREDQEFAMQMTKNMSPSTTDWKLDIGPTPQSSNLKSNETKLMIELKSRDMPAVTNTYKEIKPNQDLFQKPLCAAHYSINYCNSMDSKLKDQSSSALHNDRTPGVYVNELQQYIQSFKNDIDMLKVEHLAWKEEIVQHQKEVEEKRKQKSSKRKVSGNMYNAAAGDSDGWSQKCTSEHTDKQQLPILKSEDSDRFPLREEKEKRQKSDMSCEKNRVQSTKKEEHSIKEVEMHPQLETTIRKQDMPLEIIRENEVVEERNYTQRQPSSEQKARIFQDGILSKHCCKPKISESSDKEKSLLHENRKLWDEIAKLRLDIDTLKNQTQGIEKKYIEDIAILKEKNDHLQKKITEKEFQHNTQLEVLRDKCIMLNRKLENEQQNRGRLEAEVKSYQFILATAVQDHEHSQTSERDLLLASQIERDELWDKINLDISNLKHNNEILSQQLSQKESKINSLENELRHIRDAHQEGTLVLETGLSQKQCEKEETKHAYEEEQGKVDKDIAKQESLLKRISHLESENMLLRQQLDQAHNKADRKGKTGNSIQDQIVEIIKVFDDENKNYVLRMNELIKKLINELHLLKDRTHRYENDNVKRDATVKQLQQELANTKQKLSIIEVFLEIDSRHSMHLEDKKQDFKNKLNQSRSQNDEPIAKLQLATSKSVRLDEEKTRGQEFLEEALIMRLEELRAKREKWKQKVINLRTDMKMPMAEECKGEKYKQKIDEIIKSLEDKITQLELFLQTQRASQETSEELLCMHNASVRSHHS